MMVFGEHGGHTENVIALLFREHWDKPRGRQIRLLGRRKQTNTGQESII